MSDIPLVTFQGWYHCMESDGFRVSTRTTKPCSSEASIRKQASATCDGRKRTEMDARQRSTSASPGPRGPIPKHGRPKHPVSYKGALAVAIAREKVRSTVGIRIIRWYVGNRASRHNVSVG